MYMTSSSHGPQAGCDSGSLCMSPSGNGVVLNQSHVQLSSFSQQPVCVWGNRRVDAGMFQPVARCEVLFHAKGSGIAVAER